jgi:hypothetical protein
MRGFRDFFSSFEKFGAYLDDVIKLRRANLFSYTVVLSPQLGGAEQ